MARVLIIGLRTITTGSGEQIAKCRSSILRHLHDLYKEIFGIQWFSKLLWRVSVSFPTTVNVQQMTFVKYAFSTKITTTCSFGKSKASVVSKFLLQLSIFYILIISLMHWLLFIHKIIFSSTCFEAQVLIFRRIQLYTCNIWYCHSLWEFLVACR